MSQFTNFPKKLSTFITLIYLLLFPKIHSIIENPILITSKPYPFIIEKDDSYNIITSGKYCTLNKSTLHLSCKSFTTYSNPYIGGTDEYGDYYIHYKDGYIKITITDSSTSYTSNSITNFSTDSQIFLGYLKEGLCNGGLSQDIINIRCTQQYGERITYGKFENNKIRFYYYLRNIYIDINVCDGLEDKISCKKPKNSEYLCAVVCNGKVHIALFIYGTKYTNNNSDCQMEMMSLKEITILNSHTNVNLYDTSNNNKILCAKRLSSNYIDCLEISYTIDDESTEYINPFYKKTYLINFSGIDIIKFSKNVDELNNYCSLKQFNNEYLFCCGGTDIIKCTRYDMNYNSIEIFSMKTSGEKTHLEIFTNSDYALIFYMNSYSKDQTYAYYIHIPECINTKIYNIFSYESINENKELGNEETINDFFTRKTNSDYYIKFLNLPTNYGILKFNNETIINSDLKLINESTSNILDFISTNNLSVTNFTISYSIYTQFSYETQCYFTLNIKKCYESCYKCTKEDSETNLENHFCKPESCNIDYYVDPIINTNCWKISEKKSNWFFNETLKKFGVCDFTCATCDGPQNNNCISCNTVSSGNNFIYFLDGKCNDNCPEKYEKIYNNDKDYYFCEKKCHENCETCSMKGDDINMKCDTCLLNYISYQQNCYKEYNSNDKTFYLPDGINISSCKQLFNNYIQENTYNCVDNIPSTGFFLKNENTGLFSACHSDCKTCIKNEDINSKNCLTCKNNLFLSEGNCITDCEIGFAKLETEKKCIKCHENCLSCSNGPEYNNLNQLIKMNCLTCKKNNDLSENNIKVNDNCFNIITYNEQKIIFDTSEYYDNTKNNCYDFGLAIYYNQYECITKPDYTFYVLETNENSGLIKNCSKECSTCIKDFDIKNNDTNCINCANGYYKTEDSNTICILESLIPKNYYKKNDNIYYKCYQNCSTCNNGYEIDINTGIENFNCDQCKENNYKIKNTNNCYGEEITKKGYRLIDNFWQNCHINCKTCDIPSSKNLDTGEEIQNCLSCINGYNFIFDSSNCANNSIINSSYYLSKNDNKYHKCSIQCNLCDDESSLDNHHCLSCNENSGYYLAEKKLNTNCYNSETIDNGYILYNKIWMKCYDTCQTCTNIGNLTNNLCTSCIQNYYFIHNEKNCINETFAYENGYYLNLTYNEFLKCDISCLKCSNAKNNINTNCDKCNNDLGYYNIQGKSNTICVNKNEIENGYFLNNISNLWEKCYEKCSQCSKNAEENQMNCDSCISNYTDENGNIKNLFLYEGNCITNCPNDLYYTYDNKCVTICPDNTFKITSNKTCSNNCPENYIKQGKTCLNTDLLNNKTATSDLIKTIENDIISYIDPNRIIDSAIYKMQIINSSDMNITNQLKNNISAIYLGECANILKKQYNISDYEDIIIFELETKKNNSTNDNNINKDMGKNVKFLIYDYSGNELNLSYCEGIEINIIKSISDIKEINIEQAKEFSELGIDVFNENDSFFNELCYPFKTNTSSDITLNDRRNDLYQNVTFCEDGCVYSGVNYDLLAVNCSCDISVLKNDKSSILNDEEPKKGITLNDITTAFTKELLDFNYLVVKCYNLVFDSDIIKKNVGFFTFFIMMIIEFILMIIFIKIDIKPIENYMLVFAPFDPREDPHNPPHHKRNNNMTILNDDKKNFEINIEDFDESDIEDKKNNSKIKDKSKINSKNDNSKYFTYERKVIKKNNKNFDDKNDDYFDDAIVVHYSDDTSQNYKNKKKKTHFKKISEYNNKNHKSYKEKNKNNSINISSSIDKESKISEIYDQKINCKNSTQIFKKNYINNISIFNIDDNLSKNYNKIKITKRKSIQTTPNDLLLHLKNYNKNSHPHKSINNSKNTKQNSIISPISPIKIKTKKKLHRNLTIDNFTQYDKSLKLGESIIDKKSHKDIIKLEENYLEKVIEEKEDKNINKNSKKKPKILLESEKEEESSYSSNDSEEENNNKIYEKTSDNFTKNKNSKNDFKTRKNLKNKKINKNLKYSENDNELDLKQNKKLERNSIISELKINSDKKLCSTNENILPHRIIKTNKNNKANKKSKKQKFHKIVSFAFTNEELLDMNYEEALKHEKRSLLQIYWGYLIEIQNILYTFISDSYLDLRIIRISFLIFTFEISYFLNALFYTDSYISDTYENNGVLDFVSSLPKSIYSFLLSAFLAFFLSILSTNKDQLKLILAKRKNKKEYIKDFTKVLKYLKIKLIIFFCLVIFLGLGFWYYVSAFCAVYQNSQYYWLYGCLESTFLDFCTSFLICFILACLRYITLKKQLKCLYELSKFVGKFM